MLAQTKEKIYFTITKISAYVGILILIVIVVTIFNAGYKIITWNFLTSMWSHQDITKGGIFPAIIGTLFLGAVVTFISFPFGVATAIYLIEYGDKDKWKNTVEVAIRNLSGVPSVVYGLFGLAVFVHLLELGTSILAASLTLSAMTLPWIITASSEALKVIPNSYREASLALGATQWQTIKRIVIPIAFPSFITGSIISIARALGETAPIILVGATFYLTKMPTSIFDKFMALPYHSFILSTQHADPRSQEYAAGTAIVLIFLIFLLSIGAILIRLYFRKKRVIR